MLFIAGDFSVKIGPEEALHTFNPETNRNGQLLADLEDQFNLIITNTKFQNSQNKLWIFSYLSGEKGQFSYILSN